MRPNTSKRDQFELFQSRLEQIINMEHPLVKVAREIDWEYLDKKLGETYVEDFGRPGLPTQLMAGIHYLKYAYDESDESAAERFLENPYWQYFCGFEYFQHELPFDPSSLVRWRHRIGSGGAEDLLKNTIESAKKSGLIDRREMSKVNVDTTVEEKAIAYPTDAGLYDTARKVLVREAEERGITLRQSYRRVGKRALLMQSRYRHARQMKRAKREVRRLRTILGRVIRDVMRKCADPDSALLEKIGIAERIYSQKRDDKNKVYSFHAPEVECISKGKAAKKYEFGCKVSVVSTSRNNWVVGIEAHHGNPYDGHTLSGAIAQAERLSGMKCAEIYCDRGYRGPCAKIPEKEVHIVGRRTNQEPPALRKWMKRRSAIEPIIGHMKSDNGLVRNQLLGKIGDRINAILSGCGFNIRKLVRAFFLPDFWEVFFGLFRLEPLPEPQIQMVKYL